MMLLHRTKNKKVIISTVLFLVLFGFTNYLLVLFSFPDEVNVIQGQNNNMSYNLLFNLVLDNRPKSDSIDASNCSSSLSSFLMLQDDSLKKQSASVRLLGVIPVKKVTVNVIPDIKVIPSGETIGVKIESKGVLVVGLSSVTDENGRKFSPAADAGFEIGDRITTINGRRVETENDIVELLNNRRDSGREINVTVVRNNKPFYINVKPVKSAEDNLYKIGLWVRDSIAGVGTMTFYDPQTKTFGALGHGITDIDSGVMIDINKGSIVRSKVATIQKAKRTAPGELVGIFYESSKPYGIISKNTAFGIYGRLNDDDTYKSMKPMSIGLSSEVREGPAKILTTIEENKIEEFDVEIQKVNRQYNPDSKSMLIRVTDPRLLEKTGGIVQGMSGSPIIQNGKLIGSVTHVLINDPTRGYGVFIEWMLQEANNKLKTDMKPAAGQ